MGPRVHQWGCLCLAFGLWLLSGSGPVLADPPPKLIFKKQIPLQRDKGVFKYRVHKGDYVYAILRSFDVPEGKLPLVTEQLKRLNPHIEDLDRIEPGMRLNLPKSIHAGSGHPEAAPKLKKSETGRIPQKLHSVNPIPYTVSKGDHLAEILRRELRLPDRLIFDEYMNLFKKLNPDISDINSLEVGQRITLPSPSQRTGPQRLQGSAAVRDDQPAAEERAKETGKAEGEEPEEIEPGPQPYQNKDMVLAMLEKLGLHFAPGKEMLYPFAGKGWLQINLEQMPLANAPWGDSVLFVPESLSQKIQDRDFQSAGLQVCMVPGSWNLVETFQALEETSQGKIVFWGQDRSLILNRGHGVLEIRSDFLLIKDTGTGKHYYPFHIDTNGAQKPSQLLLAYLAGNNIRLYKRSPGTSSRPSFIRHDYPSMDSVYVPTLRRQRAWADLQPNLSGNSTLPEPENGDFASVFRAYQAEGLAAEETFRFHLIDQPGCRIILRMPVFSFRFSERKTLVMSEDQANPYLVALLSLRGFNCFALSRGSSLEKSL